MKIIVFDFEVFKYDTLLGVYDVNNNRFIQMWDLNDIKEFYYKNTDAIWVGHNNTDYDNHILQAIIKNKNTYDVSNNIIHNSKRYYLGINLYYYDIMQFHITSLKTIEASVGKRISESEVDFNLNRPLTPEEKLLTEQYNRDDLLQTFDNLKMVKNEFQIKLDLIKEFELSYKALSYTQAQLAECVLKVKKLDKIDDVKPIMYPQLKIQNQDAINFYMNEEFKTSKKLTIELCGVKHQIGAGGIHGYKACCKYDWAYYFDVSGYYNLVMINYNLLSRAIPDEGKELYKFMYKEQLRLKKINPEKRAIYKTILLAVFGAQMNKHCALYDPSNGALVPMVGQMFLIDLLEKLDGKIDLIQTNTDGVIAKPLVDDEIVVDIINEWQNRTGFNLKLDKIYNIVQRDVNCYMYRDDKGEIHTKGEAVKYYNNWNNCLISGCYNSKEPIIIHQCIVEWFMNGKKPEITIVENSNNLKLFQYICKTLSYDYLEFKGKKLQKVNRCFASKTPGMVYKCKQNKHDKYSNLPDKVFIFNDDLTKLDKKDIDFTYYAKRAWERIKEFEPSLIIHKKVIREEPEYDENQLSIFDFINNEN